MHSFPSLVSPVRLHVRCLACSELQDAPSDNLALIEFALAHHQPLEEEYAVTVPGHRLSTWKVLSIFVSYFGMKLKLKHQPIAVGNYSYYFGQIPAGA